MNWRRLISIVCFAATGLVAGLTPLFLSSVQNHSPENFPGWPDRYENNRLSQLQLSTRERRFVEGFPGQIGRFSDGQRELILRWVEEPSRRLHPAADCFRGLGYTIDSLPVQHNSQGIAMGCFIATNAHQKLRVCEFVQDRHGNTWPDVSSWYWQALVRKTEGGWWSYVIAERYAAGQESSL